MVNSGAIATTSLLPGATPEDKWHFLCDGLSRFAGRALSLADDVYRSASETNMRNRSIAFLLRARDRIYCDPLEALDLYTRQSCLSVTARDLAVMGATLADGGVNPITRRAGGRGVVVPADACGDDHRRPLRDLGRTGSTRSDCLPRAASGAASSPSPPARAASARSPRCWTAPETVSRASSRRGSSRIGWACTSSRRHP